MSSPDIEPKSEAERKSGCVAATIFGTGVAVISLLVFVLPTLFDGQYNQNDSDAVRVLKCISDSEEGYHINHGFYADNLVELELNCEGYIQYLESSDRGHDFLLKLTDGGYAVTATLQVPGDSGTRSFFIDQTGILRHVAGVGPANENSPRISEPPGK